MPEIEDEENPDDGPGLIKLDMKQFGSGSMEDPLRHAVAMRTAQDQHKMAMWNSFPSVFQNTIFHGEQDKDINQLRSSGTLAERIAHAQTLKDEGTGFLKAATASSGSTAKLSEAPQISDATEALQEEILQVEASIASKEQELKALRQQLKSLKARYEKERGEAPSSVPAVDGMPAPETAGLEDAIRSYEKAAGLLRYVECIRPDWKNEDGSYKGIEDEHLRVDETALQGDGPEAAQAKELVTSCYLNIALASQKLGKYDDMKKACDEVIAKVNPNCVKAYYRRAQARIAPASAVDDDREAAIKDLLEAVRLSPQDKDVRALLAKLRAEKKRQESNDRNTYAGMFQRGAIVTNDPRKEGEGYSPAEWDLNDPKVQELLDVRPGPGGFRKSLD
eukprot:TRINITY_DN97451_c0_g1_i1.p1 TRINITY_DN97451_c0_g1~~TRINITY_DN97451_c0_g1_i1.p1  ORF type:complete len:392 (+),score=113.41 TRINITY_DN97451_c0_g1_i1:76-1251(+)